MSMEERLKVSNFADPAEMAALLAGETEEEAARSTQVIGMRRWVDEEEPAVALLVKCSSGRRKKQCGQIVGRVWSTPDGFYLRTSVMPFIEGTVTHLADAVRLRAEGMPGSAAVTEAAADPTPTPWDGALSNPLPGLGGRVLIGCPHHGNAAVSTALLEREAASPRRKLNLDTLRNFVD